MASIDEPRPLTFRAAPLVASLAVIVALVGLYWAFSGSNGPSDWAGYQRIWDQDGGYLATGGRDPLFVWGLRGARAIFGSDGYEAFRLSLFVAMTAFAGVVTYRFPTHRVTAMTTALAGLAIWGIKSVVQIREGVALVFIAWALVLAFRYRRSAWWVLLIGCGLACLTHLGTTPFLLASLAAAGLSVAPHWLLNGRWPQRWSLLVGIALGAAVAWFCVANARLVELSLIDMTEDTKAQTLTGAWKSAYWVAQGAIVLALRSQLIRAAVGGGKTAYALATVLASIVLPAVYVVCAALVLTNFYLPAATAFGGRLLFTVQTVALMIVGLRGRGNLLTAGISAVLVAVELRQLLTTSGW